MRCRHCNNKLSFEFIDLVSSPPSNEFLTKRQLLETEIFYPLKLFVCEKCYLVQIDEYKKSIEIFHDNYLYFSSFSKIWLEHSKRYTEMVKERFGIDENSFVVEIGSNDGYLLQYFHYAGIPCLGIEPSSNTAKIAIAKGINVIEEYFNEFLAKKLEAQNLKADLLIGNNVLAHQPNLNDFVKGLKVCLKPNGVISLELPHLMQLIDNNQFDTIYHEHYSYLSVLTVRTVLEAFGLEMFDVEQIETHGGSLRIYAKHKEDKSKEISNNVEKLIKLERSKKMDTIEYYKHFQKKANKVKYDFLKFLIDQKLAGKKVAAYGAAAKGNTLLNYCGINSTTLEFIGDLNKLKQDQMTPGTHIPVVDPRLIAEKKIDYLLILAWNFKEEIIKQQNYIREWGGKFIIPIPRVEIL